MKVIRVFPRITEATPNDENVRIAKYPGFFDECDEVHISVAFTWDLPFANDLYNSWSKLHKTQIGGPALNEIGGKFTPGLYLKNGITITSRGCNNKCWFCSVWKREKGIKELPIKGGWNVIDDNLLACSDQHIINVFKMLKTQKNPIEFTGGIEAKLLKPWHVELLSQIRLKQLFCAYDTPDDYEPLIEAGKLLRQANITMENRKARCYVLIGYPNDTISKAEKRIQETVKAGYFPFAMLWRNEKGEYLKDWKQFQRQWANPIITAVNVNKYIQQ
jgi:hypothetical protein